MLSALAERFRPAGLMLMAVRADGSVAYADPSAAAFYKKYVLPVVRLGGPTPEPTVAGATYASWRHIPGALVAGFSCADRRTHSHAPSVLLLAGRAEGFDLTPDLCRACGRVSVDPQELAVAADEVPGYTPAALENKVRLLQASYRDLQKSAGLEHEVNTLSQQLSETYEELSLIYQLSGGMKVNRRPVDFFRQACLDVMQVMGVQGMGVALRLDIAECPPPALYGRMSLSPAQLKRLSDELLVVLRHRRSPLLIARLAGDRTFGWLGESARQLLAVPLMRGDEVLGCLFALDKEEDEFDSVDSKLLASIANESAIYLENATLYDDVHGLMMGLLHSLTSAVDAKDAYTCGHSERVALLSRHLAMKANLSDADVEQVYMAGLLHDVGKIGVPEAVLQKAGRLTAEEFEHMKRHPEIGARILADVKQLKSVIPGVLHHHERWDGRGYPFGLSGERIPMMGRIICLADCFDAMTSNRTYRRALPVEVAQCEIRRCSGTQFDPWLAEAFIKTEPDALRELLRDHKERSKQLIETQESIRLKAA
jgi:HD-GYP domain-containing protein (c-di-GMP phosphodiesterase class II)